MKIRSVLVTASAVALLTLVSANAHAQGTPVFSNLPSPTPPNVPSQGFQCCATSEIGDEIKLEADTPRRAGYATVLMSDWALQADYPLLSSGGYTHPITLNIYKNAADAAAHSPVKTVTQIFTIPWRPVNDPTCTDGTSWKATDGQCYHGFAFTITFDLRPLNYNLPNQFIYGIAYNTSTWGYNPIGLPGPYDSLNVGMANVNGVVLLPSVGTDVNPDVVYWNTAYGPFYTDGGAGGVGFMRPDTGWSNYPISVKFTTFAMPNNADDCKNGAWQNLVRADFTLFKNQGACVSYVKLGDRDGHGDKYDDDKHGDDRHDNRHHDR